MIMTTIMILFLVTAPFNWSGNPAVSLPCGFTKTVYQLDCSVVKRGELSLIQASKAFRKLNLGNKTDQIYEFK